MVTASDRLALQLAVNHVAALVGPDTAALHACAAVGEADRVRNEPNRWALCPGEQHRPCQVEDGRAIIRTQTQRPARTCCSPRALEREPSAGRKSLRWPTAWLVARDREKKSRPHQPSTPGQQERMSLKNHFPLPSSRTTMLLLFFIAWLSGRLNRW